MGKGNFPAGVNLKILITLVWCQDGATIHTSNASLNLLQAVFGDRVMTGRRRGGMMDWPANSPDLSAADFWLHGYLKVTWLNV